MLLFDVTWGGISVIGVLSAFVAFYANKRWDLWSRRKEKKRDRLLDWHRETIELMSEVISVGRRMKRFRRPPEEFIEGLIPTTVKLDAKVHSLPIWVEMSINPKVRQKAVVASGLAYHLAHLPQPDRNEDSIAGIMFHYYEIIELLDIDTTVQVKKAIELIGDLDYSGNLDMTDEQAIEILEEFEAESKQRMKDWEEMTVEELMQLPWEKVDEVVSEEDRQKLVEYCIDTYYEQALVEKPKKAREALRKSEQQIAG